MKSERHIAVPFLPAVSVYKSKREICGSAAGRDGSTKSGDVNGNRF